MRSLLSFIQLFKYAKFPLLIGIILMISGLVASISLLTLSGWFLATTAIVGAHTLFNFFYPSASVRGFAIGRTVARYFEKIVTHDATFRVLAKLRVQVFNKIIPLSPAVLNRYRNTDLLNRLVADVDTLDNLYLRLIAPFISAIVVIIVMTITLSFFNKDIALGIGLTLSLLLLLIPSIFYYLGNKFGSKLTQSRTNYRTQFIEFIQLQAELLLFDAKQPLKEKIDLTEKEWQSYQQREANLSGFSTALLLFINGLILVTTLWFAASANFGNWEYPKALIGLFALAALASFEILMPIGAAFLHIGQIVASADRVTEITSQQPVVQFSGSEILTIMPTDPIITIKDLSFHYPERTEFAITHLNLSILMNQKIAILGKTGSGKSTLLQLLVRHYDAQQGQLQLAGKDIREYSETSLRENICFLTQRVHIFSDTLRNNLQIANSEPISDEVLIDILQQVGLEKLLEQTEGLNLWLGDGGRPLSGGEQRRLGLARVLLSKAPIVLLDEPTEGLDRETERHILTLILTHCQEKTLLMVTHRLTAIDKFNQIYIIDNTKLIEKGTYNELISQPQSYFNQLIKRI